MKLHRLILAILVIGVLGCQSKKNAIINTGKILKHVSPPTQITKLEQEITEK